MKLMWRLYKDVKRSMEKNDKSRVGVLAWNKKKKTKVLKMKETKHGKRMGTGTGTKTDSGTGTRAGLSK